MPDIISSLRHPKEKTYGGILSIVGIVIWALVGFGLVFSLLNNPVSALVIILEIGFYLGLIAFFIALYRAYIFGHYVLEIGRAHV